MLVNTCIDIGIYPSSLSVNLAISGHAFEDQQACNWITSQLDAYPVREEAPIEALHNCVPAISTCGTQY
jgi:hypothetical protein